MFVSVAQASPATVNVQLSGTMSPITEAPVLARAEGYLKKRLVDIGDRVRFGQALCVIAAPDLDEQVAQAASLVEQSKANLEESHASLDQARANAGIAAITAARWDALVKEGAVSRQANDNYQFAFSAPRSLRSALLQRASPRQSTVSVPIPQTSITIGSCRASKSFVPRSTG